jgi:hypothetical protein
MFARYQERPKFRRNHEGFTLTFPQPIRGANVLTLGVGGLTNSAQAAITLSTAVDVGAIQTRASNPIAPVTISGVVSSTLGSDLTLAPAVVLSQMRTRMPGAPRSLPVARGRAAARIEQEGVGRITQLIPGNPHSFRTAS